MGSLRTPTTARSVLRNNPRRRLRADARVYVDYFTIEQPQPRPERSLSWGGTKPIHEQPGVYWMRATFYDPEVDRDPREFEEDDFWDVATDKFYKKTTLGGVWAWWPSEAEWAAGQPGTVEYIAAGNGFGPDILEAAADLFERPLVLGKAWSAAINLFKRYGGAVAPKGGFRFLPVQRRDARFYSGLFAIKTAASDAYNLRDWSAGILPRYQMDGDRYAEDAAKLAADEQR